MIYLIRGLKNKILILVQNYFIKEILIKILSIEGFEVQNKECKQNKIYKFIKKNEKNSFVVLTHGEYKFSTDDYENIIFLSPNLRSIRKIEIMQSFNKEESTKVYSIIYKNSLEEQKLVNEIRNESE
ncbi:DNA repair protein RAD16 [Gurleya vavrai]